VNSHRSFADRLRSTYPVIVDGAINTELARKGLRFSSRQWLTANLDAPRVVGDIHRSYAKAGAEVHIANSFSAARHALEPEGLGDFYELINREAVRLCREAVETAASHEQWIAGSISSYASGFDPRHLPPLETLSRNCSEQAALLVDAGCDLLALEMLFDVETAVAMIEAVAAAGVPVCVGLVCTVNAAGDMMLDVQSDAKSGAAAVRPLHSALPEIIAALAKVATPIVAVMHCATAHTAGAIEAIAAHWDGLIGAYPNVGMRDSSGTWCTSEAQSPVAFGSEALQWSRSGATLIGGCCGSEPAHIQALVSALQADTSSGLRS